MILWIARVGNYGVVGIGRKMKFTKFKDVDLETSK